MQIPVTPSAIAIVAATAVVPAHNSVCPENIGVLRRPPYRGRHAYDRVRDSFSGLLPVSASSFIELQVLALRHQVSATVPDAHRAREDQHPEGAARHLRCVGFVISNGYRGDYATWDVAIRRNVMIGTIEDIREIAASPIKMIEVLRSRAGFKQKPSDAPIPRPSRFRLGSWNIELTV